MNKELLQKANNLSREIEDYENKVAAIIRNTGRESLTIDFNNGCRVWLPKESTAKITSFLEVELSNQLKEKKKEFERLGVEEVNTWLMK